MSAGRSGSDTVWRQAARSEEAALARGASGVLLWDLKKFYDTMCHAKLEHASAALGYPRRCLRLNLWAYSAPRHLVLEGHTSRGIVAWRSVVAGCGAATTLVKVYYKAELSQFAALRPLVHLSGFVDDLQLAKHAFAPTQQEAEEEVCEELAAAARHL